RLGTAAQALRRLRRIRTEDRSWNPAPAGLEEADVATSPRTENREPDGEPALASTVSPGPGPGEQGAPDPEAVVWAPGTAAATPAQPRSAEPDEPGAPAAVERSAGDEPSPVAPSVLAHVVQQPSRPAAEADAE